MKPEPKRAPILDGHPYVPHNQPHCVQDTWRRFGWQPVTPIPKNGTDITCQQKGVKNDGQ